MMLAIPDTTSRSFNTCQWHAAGWLNLYHLAVQALVVPALVEVSAVQPWY